ncbi:MAG: PQQ-binding-like beta-propeller repeat protein [Planctomycetales bacterium]
MRFFPSSAGPPDSLQKGSARGIPGEFKPASLGLARGGVDSRRLPPAAPPPQKNPAEQKSASNPSKASAPADAEQVRKLLTTGVAAHAPPSRGASDATKREGEDWGEFLGPRGDGTSAETGLLPKWPAKGPPIVWQKTIGTGYGAPSIIGNRLVVHHRKGDDEIVECFAADTGVPEWQHKYPSNFRDPYGYNNGPRCSPVLVGDRCFTFGAEGRLLCLNLTTGKPIWEVDTAAQWKIPDAFFGVGTTPVLRGQVLFVMVGGEPNAGVVAFNAQTGDVLWHNVTKKTWKAPDETYDIDDKLASYATMTLAKIHDRDHLLAFMRDGVVSLDPETGRENFHYFFRSKSFESVNAARPLVIDDKVLLTAAYRTGQTLLKVKPDGKDFSVLWSNRNLECHWSTPIVLDGFAYGFSGRHENEALLRCIDLKNGRVRWETDGAPKGADAASLSASQFYGRGSAILAEGKMIVLGERGVLALLKFSPEGHEEISRVKYPALKYPSWAAPILSRRRLYLRSEEALMCLDLQAEKPK